MSFNTNGFSGSPISASKVTGFFDATLAVLQEIGTLPGGGAGLLAVAITGGNLSGNGQSANPLYLNDLITVTDVHTNNLSASNVVTASRVSIANNLSASKATGSFYGDGKGLYCLTASGISNFTADTRAQLSAGANLNYSAGQFALNANVNTTSVTASFNGDGCKITNITASNISNWSKDVRSQLSGNHYVTYNTGSGNISLTYTGSVIGTTPIILGQTSSVLTGLTSFSSSVGNFNQLTSSFSGTYVGNGNGLVNLTASSIPNFTADTRAQFSAGTNINITNGIVSTVDVPTNSQVSSSITASFSTVTASNAVNAQTASYVPSGSAIPTFTNDVRNQLSAGANLNYSAGQFALNANVNTTSVTASFNGNGSQITNITASNISNFTADVRSQISGSQYASYNSSTGIISLPYTGSLIGTTPIVLGQTASVLSGLSSISASNITASYVTASVVVTNYFVTGSTALGANLQILTGSNRPANVITLNGSTTVTVTNSLVTANSLIFLTKQSNAKNNGVASIVTGTKTAGSFGVASNVNNDNDLVAYLIINPI